MKTKRIPIAHAGLMLGWILVGGCGDSSDSGVPPLIAEDGGVPPRIAEHVEQSLGRYVGAFTPAEEAMEDGVKTHAFAVPEDPLSEPRGPLCLRGDAFRMSTREGSSDELLIFMQGGGACWETNCGARETATPFFAGGVLDPSLAGNPVADANVVFMPNCDGSIYLGDVDRMLAPNRVAAEPDPEPFMGYQRGLQNLTAALDVGKREFPNPSRVVIVAASAGAFGSLAATSLVRTYYPGVDILLFNDSGIGVATGDAAFLEDRLLDGWNISGLIPDTCTDCTTNGHATRLVEWNLEQDPRLRISSFTFSRDFVISVTLLDVPGEQFEMMYLEETA
ncbi:MAG: hypothetical protein ACR2QM_01630, partial [Longimicrobiales bacterium]